MTGIRAALAVLGLLAALLPATAAAAGSGFEHALALAADGRHREARHTLDPVLEREPGNPHARLLHGILRVYEGDRAQAIAVFLDLAHDFPEMFEAHHNLAVLYLGEDRLEDAQDALSAALQRRPVATGYRSLGDIYVQLAQRAYARSRSLGHPETTGEEANAVPAPQPPRRKPPIVTALRSEAACVLAGEFENPRAAEDAQRWLSARGAQVLVTPRRTRETIKDYRVYIPPLESHSKAAQKVRELLGRGVADVAVIPRGPLRNAVSLGVYAKQANLERRVAALEELGYSVEWAPNTRTVDESLSIEANFSSAPDTLLADWTAQFPGYSIRHADCG